MDPMLISGLTDVFACQMDFNRQIQENDRWRLTVERLYVDGKPIGYGDIIAAEYDTGKVATAVRYVGDGGRVECFARAATACSASSQEPAPLWPRHTRVFRRAAFTRS